MKSSFEDIIAANYTQGELDSMSIVETDNMPKVTPGEGGAFGLAALLIGTGLVADMTEMVQIACIIGGVLLGCVGSFTTGRIRVARNEHAATKAVADAELAAILAEAEAASE